MYNEPKQGKIRFDVKYFEEKYQRNSERKTIKSNHDQKLCTIAH